MRENLAGNSCGKFLQENLAGKSCGKCLREILAGKAAGHAVGNLAEKVLMVCNRSWHLWEIFKPITTIKTLSNYFYLVEEVLSFDLVGYT